jgi:hypothetical protein
VRSEVGTRLSPLVSEVGTERGNEVVSAYENHQRIPGAALFLVVQSDRTGCAHSQNDSMAGFGLPQARHFQGVSLLISSIAAEPRGNANGGHD